MPTTANHRLKARFSPGYLDPVTNLHHVIDPTGSPAIARLAVRLFQNFIALLRSKRKEDPPL